MDKLVELIGAYLERWHSPFLLQAIFRRADPQLIASTIVAFCQSQLGSAIDETRFFEASQGAVFGLRLSDGRGIVIKAHPPTRSLAALSAVFAVQRYLVASGYPCPDPLLPPKPLAAGHAVVEELVDEGVYHDAHDPFYRRSLAQMLAQLIKLLNSPAALPDVDSHALDRRLPSDVLWPAPHNAIFDFSATSAGAEWIDDIARRAKAAIASGAGKLVIGHTDWSIKHFRYIGKHVRVIYDWDSLALDKEPVIVAGAATGFTYNEMWTTSPFPTPEESFAFVQEYELARGQPFTQAERSTLAAARAYNMAYAARCEHSLHPQERSYPEGSLRAALAAHQP